MQRVPFGSKATRPTIEKNLFSEFYRQKAEYNYNHCRNASLQKIKENDFVGIFDNYPALLCADDMNALRNRFVDILRNIPVKDVRTDDNNDLAGNTEIKLKIDALVRDIATLGSAELLDAQQKVRPIIYTLLKLNPEEYAPLFEGKGIDLVKAFVSTTQMHLQMMAREYINLYKAANLAVSRYVNQNSKALIEQGMAIADRNIVIRDAMIDLKMVGNYAPEHPVQVGIAATTAFIVGAVGIGLMFGAKALVEASVSSAPGFKLR